MQPVILVIQVMPPQERLGKKVCQGKKQLWRKVITRIQLKDCHSCGKNCQTESLEWAVNLESCCQAVNLTSWRQFRIAWMQETWVLCRDIPCKWVKHYIVQCSIVPLAYEQALLLGKSPSSDTQGRSDQLGQLRSIFLCHWGEKFNNKL